jgi:ribosomal protein L40E
VVLVAREIGEVMARDPILKKCAGCGGLNSKTARVCVHCGQRFTE